MAITRPDSDEIQLSGTADDVRSSGAGSGSTSWTGNRFRKILKWLFSHAGGTIPMLAGRIESFFDRAGNRDRFAPDGIEAEFRRLYYDTANATHPASMAALTSLIPMSQITFGSDYPFYPLNQIENLRHRLRPEELAAISSGNAARLLPRLSAYQRSGANSHRGE